MNYNPMIWYSSCSVQFTMIVVLICCWWYYEEHIAHSFLLPLLYFSVHDVLLYEVSHIGMLYCLQYSMYRVSHQYCVLLLMMFHAGYLRKLCFVASEVNSQCYISALVMFYAVWLLCSVLLPAYLCPVFF